MNTDFRPQEPEPKRSYVGRANRESAYDIVLTDETPASALANLRRRIPEHDFLVVTTPTVNAMYNRSLADLASSSRRFLVLNSGERNKSLGQVERVCRRAEELGLGRRGVLVAVGGGVCSDITTVAAAWLRRGIRHVRVPTTLVGQVDAGLGYKGAINFLGHKSYLGCFHAPSHVLIVPEFLRTLPARNLRDGFAEIIKIAIVCDQTLLALVERHAADLVGSQFRVPLQPGGEILWRSAVLMLGELEKNPYEDGGYERLVDFGHTFSPLIETYSGHQISHGEAVAIDMALTVALATELGLLAPRSRDRVLLLLARLALPTSSRVLTPELCRQALEAAALHRGGRPNLVLPVDDGSSRFLFAADLVRPELLERALQVVALHGANDAAVPMTAPAEPVEGRGLACAGP